MVALHKYTEPIFENVVRFGRKKTAGLILSMLCFTISNLSFAQNELKQLLRYGDELFEKGDYYYAKTYYDQAMQIDSQTVAIQWKYAQILTAYQDYRAAARMYSKIYKKDGDNLYPNCGLNLAKMLQQQGRYLEAKEILEKVIKAQGKEKKSLRFIWANRLLESCEWAQKNQTTSEDYVLKHLPEPLNSKHAEFPHSISQELLYFSSLRTDSIKKTEEVYSTNYRSRLYAIDLESLKNEGTISDLNQAGQHTGNGSFSLDSSRFYFTKCDDGKIPFTCKIYVARHTNGRFTHVDVLGEVINADDATTTQPAIGKINGEECLFFSSNRSGGQGGMDLYYSIIKNGNQYSKPKNIKSVNTIGDEITPFYNLKTNTLYFSSDFHIGYGGFDIFSSEVQNAQGEFKVPSNLGIPFNSPENDTYLLPHDDDYYLSSNRMGSLYSKNPTCCADIYQISLKKEEIIEETPVLIVQNPAVKTLVLPVLFFHNDMPNPRSRATTTNLDYLTTFENYLGLKNEYTTNWSIGKTDATVAESEIAQLYQDYIEKGVQDLAEFRTWLLRELESGAQLELVIRGFASPLTSSDYNVNLTMRRIQSLVNHLERYNNGIFQPYLNGTAGNGGRLSFEKIPFGEYASNQKISDDRTDVQNSVYAPNAALARRIEVKAVRFLDKNDPDAAVRVSNAKLDFGKIAPLSQHDFEFTLVSRSSEFLEIDRVEVACDCITIDKAIQTISPRESISLRGKFTAGSELGPRLIPIEILFKSGQRVTVYLGMDAG